VILTTSLVLALLALPSAFTRFQAYVKVEVDGQDVTSNLDPYLISITVTDYEYQLDQCIIELDDSNGVLPIPADNAPLKVSLGWRGQTMEMVFTGKVADVSSRCQRRSGRILIIEGKGADVYGQGKMPTSNEWGEGAPAKGESKKIKLETVMSEAAKAAGYTFKVDPELGKIERDYWSQTDESFHNFLDRIAREVGGVPKIAGTSASITSNTKNTNVNGQGMADVPCTWGDTLIAWDIHPKAGRPVFAETARHWFNDAKGVWETVKKAVGGGDQAGLTKAIHFGLMPVATEDEANAQATADASASVRARGYGWVVIDGNPSAAAGANAVVKGARALVDGSYRITEAEHSYRRRSGYTTRLELKMPGVAGSSNSGPSNEFG
jgi:phage protein D